MLSVLALRCNHISDFGSLENSMKNEKHPLYILCEYYFTWLFGFANLEDENYIEGFRNALYSCGFNREKHTKTKPEEATLPECLIFPHKPILGWSEALAYRKKEPSFIEMSKACGEMVLQLACEGKLDFLFKEATA